MVIPPPPSEENPLDALTLDIRIDTGVNFASSLNMIVIIDDGIDVNTEAGGKMVEDAIKAEITKVAKKWKISVDKFEKFNITWNGDKQDSEQSHGKYSYDVDLVLSGKSKTIKTSVHKYSKAMSFVKSSVVMLDYQSACAADPSLPSNPYYDELLIYYTEDFLPQQVIEGIAIKFLEKLKFELSELTVEELEDGYKIKVGLEKGSEVFEFKISKSKLKKQSFFRFMPGDNVKFNAPYLADLFVNKNYFERDTDGNVIITMKNGWTKIMEIAEDTTVAGAFVDQNEAFLEFLNELFETTDGKILGVSETKDGTAIPFDTLKDSNPKNKIYYVVTK